MALDGVCGETNELDAALGELGLELGESAQLGGADGGVVLGVGEEDNPVVANELVEVDGTSGGLGLEVRRDGPKAAVLRSVCCSCHEFFALARDAPAAGRKAQNCARKPR